MRVMHGGFSNFSILRSSWPTTTATLAHSEYFEVNEALRCRAARIIIKIVGYLDTDLINRELLR